MGKRVFELRYVLVLPDDIDIAACDCGEQEDLPEIVAHTYWELDGIDGYSITCPTCGDRTAVYMNRIGAIADWNNWKCGAKVASDEEWSMDDVRDLIERHSDEMGGNARCFHNGAYARIAEELNGAKVVE